MSLILLGVVIILDNVCYEVDDPVSPQQEWLCWVSGPAPASGQPQEIIDTCNSRVDGARLTMSYSWMTKVRCPSPPTGRTDITITWTVPDDPDVSRTKAWWAETDGTAQSFIFSDTSRATPNQTYTEIVDPTLFPCVFIEYYDGSSLLSNLTTELQCWDDANRDLVFEAVSPPVMGQTTLTWNPPTENEDGSTLDDLAGYLVLYGTAPNVYSENQDVPNPLADTYVIQDLAPATWYFAVSAYDTSQNYSELSNEVNKTIQ